MPDDFESNFNDGLQYFQMKQYPEAIQKFKDATNLKPSSSEAHYHLGRSYIESGDLDESIKELKVTIQLNPKDADAYFDLGRVYEAINKNREAKDDITKAIELDPENDTYKAWIYHIFSKNKQFSDAISFFRGLVEKNPKNVRNHSILGLFYNENGMLEEALTEFKEQINLEPFEFNHYVSVAAHLREMGKIKEAEEFLLDAIKSFPDNEKLIQQLVFTWLDKILQYCSEKNWDEAVKEYKVFLDRDKKDDKGNIKKSGFTLYLKERFQNKNRISDGINLFLRVFPTYPTNSQLYSGLSEFLKLENIKQEVIDDYLTSIRQGKDCAAIHLNLAFELEGIENLPEIAIDEYRRGLYFEPDLAWPHCNIGYILLTSLNKYDEAVEELREGITKDPDNPNFGIYYYHLSEFCQYNERVSYLIKAIRLEPDEYYFVGDFIDSLIESEEYVEAENFIKKVIDIFKELNLYEHNAESNYPYVTAQLAKLHEKTGQLENAIAEYRQAIKIEPDNAGWHNSLANVLLKKDNISEAIAEYHQAIKSKSQIHESVTAIYHKNLADALVKNSQILDAMNEYWEAMKLDPANDQYVGAYLTLKTSLKEKDEIERIISLKIKEISSNGAPILPKEDEFQQLISNGENEFVEFKTSVMGSLSLTDSEIRTSSDPNLIKYGRNLSRFNIAKTIAGFLNADGGHLIIGIMENKKNEKDKIVGIENEFWRLNDPCPDGYRRMIIDDVIKYYFSDEIFLNASKYIQISFQKIDNKTLCWLKMKRSDIPVFVNTDCFYKRVDAETRQIAGQVLMNYCLKRFSEK